MTVYLYKNDSLYCYFESIQQNITYMVTYQLDHEKSVSVDETTITVVFTVGKPYNACLCRGYKRFMSIPKPRVGELEWT